MFSSLFLRQFLIYSWILLKGFCVRVRFSHLPYHETRPSLKYHSRLCSGVYLHTRDEYLFQTPSNGAVSVLLSRFFVNWSPENEEVRSEQHGFSRVIILPALILALNAYPLRDFLWNLTNIIKIYSSPVICDKRPLSTYIKDCDLNFLRLEYICLAKICKDDRLIVMESEKQFCNKRKALLANYYYMFKREEECVAGLW
jgi:hypothetical protein